jgi:hypothetical protein
MVRHGSYVASCAWRPCRVAHWLSSTMLRACCWLCAGRCSPRTKCGSAVCLPLQLACVSTLHTSSCHAVCCLLHVVCYLLAVSFCTLLVGCSSLRDGCCRLHVAWCMLHAICCLLLRPLHHACCHDACCMKSCASCMVCVARCVSSAVRCTLSVALGRRMSTCCVLQAARCLCCVACCPLHVVCPLHGACRLHVVLCTLHAVMLCVACCPLHGACLLHVVCCLLQSGSAPSPSLRIVAALAI